MTVIDRSLTGADIDATAACAHIQKDSLRETVTMDEGRIVAAVPMKEYRGVTAFDDLSFIVEPSPAKTRRAALPCHLWRRAAARDEGTSNIGIAEEG